MTDWKALALWLADCHAATAEYDGHLKSTSKARRERLERICDDAAVAIATGRLEHRVRDETVVLRRLERAAAPHRRAGDDG